MIRPPYTRFDDSSKASRIKSVTDALSQTKTYVWGVADFLISITYSNAVNATSTVNVDTDDYYPRYTTFQNALGTTTFTYVPVGTPGALQIQSVDGPYGNDTVSYTYDSLGRIHTRTMDSTTETLDYDAISRLISDVNPLGTFGYGYQGETDQVTSQTLNAGSGFKLAVDYDNNNGDRQLHTLTYTPPGTLIATRKFTYTHDDEHNVLSKGDKTNTTFTKTYTYGYDDDYRLTGVSGATTSTYVIDPADNLTAATFYSQSWTGIPNANNQFAQVNGQSWTYDANGNLLNDHVNQYAWDAENRLIGVTSLTTGHVSTFKYDALGNRLAIDEQDSGGTLTETRYLYCGDRICQTRDASNNVLGHYFEQGEIRGTQTLYYARDHLGSVAGTLDATGNELGVITYSAYGTTVASSGTSADFVGYAGMFRHGPSGLYLTQYRAYSPVYGRWLSRDPIEEAGGVNLYAYVGGNPISRIDPLGLWEFQFNAGGHIYFPFTAGAAGVNFGSSWTPGGGIGDASFNGASGEYTIGSAADIGASAGIGGLSGCGNGKKGTLSIGIGKYGGIQLDFVNGHFDGINFGLGLGLSSPVTYTMPLQDFLSVYGPPANGPH